MQRHGQAGKTGRWRKWSGMATAKGNRTPGLDNGRGQCVALRAREALPNSSCLSRRSYFGRLRSCPIASVRTQASGERLRPLCSVPPSGNTRPAVKPA